MVHFREWRVEFRFLGLGVLCHRVSGLGKKFNLSDWVVISLLNWLNFEFIGKNLDWVGLDFGKFLDLERWVYFSELNLLPLAVLISG